MVLRFDKPINSAVSKYDEVRILWERISTSIEEINYIAQDVLIIDAEPGLLHDDTFNIEYDNSSMTNESYNDLSGSLSNQSLIDTILSSSYDNLNVNFTHEILIKLF